MARTRTPQCFVLIYCRDEYVHIQEYLHTTRYACPRKEQQQCYLHCEISVAELQRRVERGAIREFIAMVTLSPYTVGRSMTDYGASSGSSCYPRTAFHPSYTHCVDLYEISVTALLPQSIPLHCLLWTVTLAWIGHSSMNINVRNMTRRYWVCGKLRFPHDV